MSDEYRWYLLAKKKAEAMIVDAFKRLRDRNIEPILIKGWAAARNYPPGTTRFWGDVDLAVSSSNFDAASALANDPESGLLGVDLHRELRHFDSVHWDALFSNSQLVDIDGTPVRILAAEDHLRVLCAHWLTNGGESKERLWDIVYAVRHRPGDFDWAKCLDVVSSNRRSWVIAAIGLAHKYLDLELDGLPFADEAREVPTWLVRSVEKSWREQVLLRGINHSITNPSMIISQIRKRLPPNPVQATIDCEGAFDDGPRHIYQLRDFFGRLKPSIRRLGGAIMDHYRWSRKQ